MKYYQLKSDFISDEASFAFDSKYKNILDKSDLSIKLYSDKPLIKVREVYRQRNMSDVLKAIDLIPHQRLVNPFIDNFISGVQFIPVVVDVDGKLHHDYFYMNVFPTYSLLDVVKSQASSYSDYFETYGFIMDMVFDSNKVNKVNIKHDVFRVKEFSSSIVINEKVKRIIEENNITGVVAFPVEIV
ncbi:imm11 family protein [Photobacterium sp. Hal280]|uniref:imm11 family protein n=1 Tax=Photobacterium sp. Hal280 TaxID=3035163 RepID=UPI00301D723F